MAYIARYADKVPASAALKQAQTAQASQTSNTPTEADVSSQRPFCRADAGGGKGPQG